MSSVIGFQLRTLRKENKMTQGDLAKAARVSQQTISNIENGKITHPDSDLLETLGKILGTSLGVADEATSRIQFWDDVEPLVDFVQVHRVEGQESITIPNAFWRSLMTDVKDPTLVFSWQHQGDAMVPTLHSGDDVLVDMGNKDVIDGGLYLFSYDDEFDFCQIKRIFLLPNGTYQLNSDANNGLYPPICVEGSDIFIVGKVIAVSSIRKL